MPEWTPTQRQAIDAQNPALLVAASAGSGKTAVLVERMVTRIRAGVSLEHMLVVTFTKAATAEMRGRILQVLQDAAESGEPHLVAQALRVERA
ncbi:MAG: UvrD-helicase domain-containing protein, partial [Clostridia bacterium]